MSVAKANKRKYKEDYIRYGVACLQKDGEYVWNHSSFCPLRHPMWLHFTLLTRKSLIPLQNSCNHASGIVLK